MTSKGSDSVGSTFITHTGHLLYRQSRWRETNAKINFYLRVFGQLVKASKYHCLTALSMCPPQTCPPQQNHTWSRDHTEHHPPSDVWGVTAYHSSAKTHWLLPYPLAPSDRDMHGITLSKQCSPCVCKGREVAMCPWNQKYHPFQFLFQLVQQKTSTCPPVFCKPQGAARQHAELVKLMTE